MVEDTEGTPPKDQRLLFNGKKLDDGPTLNDWESSMDRIWIWI